MTTPATKLIERANQILHYGKDRRWHYYYEAVGNEESWWDSEPDTPQAIKFSVQHLRTERHFSEKKAAAAVNLLHATPEDPASFLPAPQKLCLDRRPHCAPQ